MKNNCLSDQKKFQSIDSLARIFIRSTRNLFVSNFISVILTRHPATLKRFSISSTFYVNSRRTIAQNIWNVGTFFLMSYSTRPSNYS